VARHEAVGVRSVIRVSREVALPVRRHQAEAVPALLLPDVHHGCFFENQVVNATFLQVIAERKAGLSAADDGNRDMGGAFRHCRRSCFYSWKASTWTCASRAAANARHLSSMRASWSAAREQGNPNFARTRSLAIVRAMLMRSRKSASA